jgi:hypothetical protein
MQRALALFVLVWLASCSSKIEHPKEEKVDCGKLPASFFSPYDNAFWADKLMGIDGPQVNQIRVHGSGELTWNAVPVDLRVLDGYLNLVSQMPSQPFTALDFKAGAPCAVIRRVRAMMEKHIRCSERRWCLRGDYKEYVRHVTSQLQMDDAPQ